MTVADALPVDLDYNTAKRLALHINADIRRSLAEHIETQPEILVFLAADQHPAVRRAIAANPRTPNPANRILARDTVAAVRQALAVKVASALPRGDTAMAATVDDVVAEILMILADDADDDVRIALAEAVKHLGSTPHGVVIRLAGDREIRVAQPVLRHSPVLTEDDLLAVADGEPIPGVLDAIAGREALAPAVADLVARGDDVDAVTTLLSNPSAQIREDTLDHLLDHAPKHEAWHQPMVKRPSLPVSVVRRLSGFIAETLLEVLRTRDDLQPEALEAVQQAALERSGRHLAQAAANDVPASKPDPIERAQTLAGEGRLTESAIEDAIFTGDRPFVEAALSVLSGITLTGVRHMLQSHSARGVVALIWKAGLPMRFAVRVQIAVANLAPQSVIYARDGEHYPMTEEELTWQLDFFGVKP